MKTNKDVFEETYMNYAIVVRGELKNIMDFKEKVGKGISESGVEYVFQTLDPRKIKISTE